MGQLTRAGRDADCGVTYCAPEGGEVDPELGAPLPCGDGADVLGALCPDVPELGGDCGAGDSVGDEPLGG